MTNQLIAMASALKNGPRIVHVGKFYPPHMGGIETHVQQLCRELAGSARVTAIVANDGPETSQEMDGGVCLWRLGTRFHVSSAPVCQNLVDAIRKAKPDLLHLHLPNPMATLAVQASGYWGPLVCTYHSDVVRQRLLGALFEPFLQRLLRRSDAIVCTSERYLDTSPVLPRFRDKCRVIPYGILPANFAAVDSGAVEAIRQRHGQRLVLAVGRLVYYKGFEYLIEAMRDVDAKLLIIGDGPLRGALDRKIAECGVGDRVEMLGEIQNEHLNSYYQASEVFVLPSIARSEAFGIVQLEAMACGLPVLNTALDSGVPFVSRHNETGMTVPPRDSAALANALSLLLGNAALRARFSAAAPVRVKTEFTAQLMGQRMLSLYQEVLTRRNRKTPVEVRTTASGM
jgi:glycosyltransferase involved in cell wall biosynthesis